jgi:hypothetical protein
MAHLGTDCERPRMHMPRVHQRDQVRRRRHATFDSAAASNWATTVALGALQGRDVPTNGSPMRHTAVAIAALVLSACGPLVTDDDTQARFYEIAVSVEVDGIDGLDVVWRRSRKRSTTPSRS